MIKPIIVLYYELIFQDAGSCIFSHKFRRNDRSHHQISYNFETYESCISYSKVIITKVISLEEYRNPNGTKRIMNTMLPH